MWAPKSPAHRKETAMLDAKTSAPAAIHPLEPLSKAEMELATATLKADARVNGAHRFVSVELNEPSKPSVLGYANGSRPKSRPGREAFAVLLDRATGHCIEAVVSLNGADSASVASWRALEGVQPAIMPDEFAECEAAVKSCPEFIEALRKRGVDDPSLAMVDPWSAGAYDTDPPEDAGRRLTRALIWMRSDPSDNAYARPVQNLVVVVDLNAMEVVRVEDYGVVPLPPEPGNWTRKHVTRNPNRPQAAGSRPRRGPQLQRGRASRPMAELAVQNRIHPARRACAAHGKLRRRRQSAPDNLPRVRQRYGSALRIAGGDRLPKERL